jgi:Winged helix DNA-binding domain
VERDQVLAFRVARHGLADRPSRTLVEAAACPASDFSRGSALLALAARSDGVTREAYERATDSGALVVAPTLRAAIHALAPADFALYGRALIAEDDGELGEQLGPSLQRQLRDERIAPRDALEEVATATEAALAGGRALTKDELHAELRGGVRSELLPWCKGCGSHHVAPMLWRFAGVRAGMRCDSRRRFLLGEPGAPPSPAEAVRRFLRWYGPSTPKDFGAWAGVARAHARRLWGELDGELAEVRLDGRRTWLLGEDQAELASPPRARGVRLLPPRDPYLQQLDRATLAPDPDLRKRLFRPVANPGVVLQDGRLAGLWRARASRRRLEIDVEALEPIDDDEMEGEAARVAELRGAEAAAVRRT